MRSRYVRFGSLGMLDTEVVMRGREVYFSGVESMANTEPLSSPIHIYYNVRARIDRGERW